MSHLVDGANFKQLVDGLLDLEAVQDRVAVILLTAFLIIFMMKLFQNTIEPMGTPRTRSPFVSSQGV